MALLYAFTLNGSLSHLWLISLHDILFGLEGYLCVHASLLIAKGSINTTKRVIIRNDWQRVMFEHGKKGHTGRPFDCQLDSCYVIKLPMR